MHADEVLHFWFEEAGPKKWYNGGDAFDALIRQRFEELSVKSAATLKKLNAHKWDSSPKSMLALILMLDQFPRNMFRGTKGAFAFDELALTLARRAVDQGFDLKLSLAQRAFIYMPFMHAENLATQEMCVRLIDMRLDSDSSLFHAKEHKKLISRFGRFPHRNKVLGRKPSQDEINYLNSGGYAP